MAQSLWVDAAQVTRHLGSLPERLNAAIGDGLVKTGLKLEREVKLAVREKHRVRTGALLNSITHGVSGNLQTGVLLEVGSRKPSTDGKMLAYARMRDLGGRIAGSNGGFLAFPIEENAKRFGITTKTGAGGVRARDVIGNPAAFGLLGTRLSRSGRAIMGSFREGSEVKWLAIFVRVRAVEQKGSGYLTETVANAWHSGLVRQYLDRAIEKSLQ